MATYLKIKNGQSEKQYTLTNAYQKPYMRVSNSVLPLTTRTTNGLHLKAQNGGTTYRPLEYKQSSSSSSVSGSESWYSSNANGAGLYSVTALTRASTSQTIYDTRASTYNTLYGYSYPGYSAYVNTVYGGNAGEDNTQNVTLRNITNYMGPNNFHVYGNPITRTYGNNYTNSDTRTHFSFIKPYYSSATTRIFFSITNTVVTGTTYQTRASTYNTRYNTRSSTYGYTGRSSSSSSSSVSNSFMTWD